MLRLLKQPVFPWDEGFTYTERLKHRYAFRRIRADNSARSALREQNKAREDLGDPEYQETVQTGLPSATQHEGLLCNGLVSPWPNLLSASQHLLSSVLHLESEKTRQGSKLRSVLEISLTESQFLPL